MGGDHAAARAARAARYAAAAMSAIAEASAAMPAACRAARAVARAIYCACKATSYAFIIAASAGVGYIVVFFVSFMPITVARHVPWRNRRSDARLRG